MEHLTGSNACSIDHSIRLYTRKFLSPNVRLMIKRKYYLHKKLKIKMEDILSDGKPGEIFFAKNNKNLYNLRSHYIIYLGRDGDREDVFLGAMLTHSPKRGNIALKGSFFKTYDKDGKPFKIIYQNSYISPELYHKKIAWLPFTKVGELTEEGFYYIMDKVGNNTPTSFKYNL